MMWFELCRFQLADPLPLLLLPSCLNAAATLAVGVAAGGLLAMFWVGTFITGAAKSLKHLEEPAAAAAPPPQKSLAELIEDRKVSMGCQHMSLSASCPTDLAKRWSTATLCLQLSRTAQAF